MVRSVYTLTFLYRSTRAIELFIKFLFKRRRNIFIKYIYIYVTIIGILFFSYTVVLAFPYIPTIRSAGAAERKRFGAAEIIKRGTE